jgi:cell division GTPase FtsZ
MFQFIGLGRCGSQLAQLIDVHYSQYKNYAPSVFLNFDTEDMTALKTVKKDRKLLLKGTGTGRSPDIGMKFAEENKKTIKTFLKEKLDPDKHMIMLFGAGGGSGSGLAPVVLDILSTEGFKVGAGMTFPDSSKSTDVNTNQNAINTLYRMTDPSFGLSPKLKPFIFIDNDYMLKSLGVGKKDYWLNVNEYITKAFLSVAIMFETQDKKDTGKGESSIDWGEMLRTFSTPGITDIRVFEFPEKWLIRDDLADAISKFLDTDSLCPEHKLNKALAYSVNLTMDTSFAHMDKMSAVFDIVAQKMPSAALRRTGNIFREGMRYTVEDVPMNYVQVTVVASGFKLPDYINKKIKRIETDANRFVKAKNSESKVKITEESAHMFNDGFSL